MNFEDLVNTTIKTMNRYNETNIVISFATISKEPHVIDPAGAQDRITQNEFNQFCQRLQFALEYVKKFDPNNYECFTIMLYTFIIFVPLLFALAVAYFAEPQIATFLANIKLSSAVLTCFLGIVFFLFLLISPLYILVYIFNSSKAKRVKKFIHLENIHFWNPKDMNWIIVEENSKSYLVLQIAVTESEGFGPQLNTEGSTVDLEMSKRYLAPAGYQPVIQHTE